MAYHLKTNDGKYLIELDIEGNNLIVNKLEDIHEEGKEYSTIFELRDLQDFDPVHIGHHLDRYKYLKMLNLEGEE